MRHRSQESIKMKKESDYTQRQNPKTHLTQKYIRKRARKITSIQNNLNPEYKCKYMGTETKYLRLQIQRSMTIKIKNTQIIKELNVNRYSKLWVHDQGR